MTTVYDIKQTAVFNLFRETIDLPYYETREAALEDAFKALAKMENMDAASKEEAVAMLIVESVITETEAEDYRH